MQLEASESYAHPYHVPFYNLRWSAVFAGLAVGVSANLILLLLGSALGLAFVNTGAKANDEGLLLIATTWNTISMVLAALIGGYVAARAAGMRRTADGVLHGVVAWAITVLLSVLLATTAAGTTLSGMLATGANRPVSTEAAVPSVDGEQRQALVEALENRLGVSAAQANRLVDEALALAGRDENVNEQERADAKVILRAASFASSWLSIAVLVSLLAAMGGGMLGARATRRATGIEQRHVIPPPHSPPATGNE